MNKLCMFPPCRGTQIPTGRKASTQSINACGPIETPPFRTLFCILRVVLGLIPSEHEVVIDIYAIIYMGVGRLNYGGGGPSNLKFLPGLGLGGAIQ